MRPLAVALVLFFSAASWARSGPCTTQSYSDPKKVPDWSCPGPDESTVVPKISFNPSMGIAAGSSVTHVGVKRPFVTAYDAILMDKSKVLELGLRIKGLRRLRWLERHKSADLLTIERKYLEDRLGAKLDLEVSRKKVAISQRNQALRELAAAKKWYRSWSFGLVVGIITTSAAAVAIGYTVK